MKKIAIKNVLIHATLYTAAACIFFQALFCMDKSDAGTLSGRGEIILSLLEKRLDLFDHHTLCALAINKKWDKLLLDTASERKKDLIMRLQDESKYNFDENDKTAIWHKYGGAWARVLYGEMWCTLNSVYYDKPYIHLSSNSWGNYQKLPGFERPRFDEQGDIYSYIVIDSEVDNNEYERLKRVQECRVLFYKRENYSCRLLLERDNFREVFIELGSFAAFPHLLKVFLNNLQINDDKGFNFCDLQQVIIPDDYKECVPCETYSTFDDLPKELKRLIEKHYLEQQKNKNERKHR